MHNTHNFIQPGKSPSGEENSPRDPQTPMPRSGRRAFLFAAASGIALAAGVSGCVAREPGLRIATNQWLGYELLHLSRDLTTADKPTNGGSVHLVELLSNSDSLQALAAGTVDGAGLTLDEAISARAAGLDLKIVLVFDISTGADVLLANPEVTELAALKGKRIGVEQTGVGALMLDAVMRRAGLKASDIQIVNLTADQHLAAYRDHKVDALVTFEPIASQIDAAGGRRLFDSREIPGAIVDVLAISSAALAASPNHTRAMLTRYFAALEHLRQHPADAAQRMAARLDLLPEEVLKGYAGLEIPDLAENRRLLIGAPARLEISAASLATLMLRQKLLARPVDVSHFIDASHLPEDES